MATLHKDFYLNHPLVDFQCPEYCWGNLEAAHPVLGKRSAEEVSAYRARMGLTVECIRGRQPPKPFETFQETSFPEFVIELALELFTPLARPFAPQAQTWPCALSGMDMIVISPTGTGKTLAYLWPAFVHVMSQPELQQGEGPIALVLVPTRELAQQTLEVAKTFCDRTRKDDRLRVSVVHGGVDVSAQLPTGVGEPPDYGCWPELLIATPGRLLSLLREKTLTLTRTSYVVCDEADLLMSTGKWLQQLQSILQEIPKERQILFFAATWPAEANEKAMKLCGDELTCVRVDPQVPPIQQDIRLFREAESLSPKDVSPSRRSAFIEWLRDELRPEEAVLVFCGTQDVAKALASDDDVCLLLGADNIKVLLDDSDSCPDRWAAYRSFVTGHSRALMTIFNLGSRGLDYADTTAAASDITKLSLAVVLFDFPRNIIEYINCIGRTARPGHHVGRVIAFLPEMRLWLAQQLQDLLKRCHQPIPEELAVVACEDSAFCERHQQAMQRMIAGDAPFPDMQDCSSRQGLTRPEGTYISEKRLWTLPPSMSSYRRRLLHAIADEEGLAHVSTGHPMRALHIATDRTALPEKFFIRGEAVTIDPRLNKKEREKHGRIADPKIHPTKRTVLVHIDDGKVITASVDLLHLDDRSVATAFHRA